MAYEYKEAQFIDTDLFSGSADPFRIAYGGYYTTIEDEGGGMKVVFSAPFPTIGSIIDQDRHSPYIDVRKGALQPEYAEVIDPDVLTPNLKIPMRIYGDPDHIKSDYHWKIIMIGGEFGTSSYRPLYNEVVHSYFNILYDFPYTPVEALQLDTDEQQTIQISYDYDHYLPIYQNYISDLDSELLIPNFDIIYDMGFSQYSYTTSSALFDSELLTYLRAENQYRNPTDLLEYNPDNLTRDPFVIAPEEKIEILYPEEYRRNTNLSVEYLTGTYVQNPLSASTQEWVESRLQNILYDSDAIEDKILGHMAGDYDGMASRLPYKMKITFPPVEGQVSSWAAEAGLDWEDADDYFLQSIADNGFSSKFIKTLYEVFGEKLSDFAPQETPYIKKMSYLSASTEEEVNMEIESAIAVTYREVDYMKFLSYCHNNYISTDEESLFIGPRTLKRASATDTTGVYRHVNSVATLDTITDCVEWMSGGQNISIDTTGDIYSEKFTQREVVAYRVEKIGGPPTGDSLTQNVLQNFWIMAARNAEIFTDEVSFFDMQVKYDTEYTYNVYAYLIAGGYRYKYSDLALTRDLGCEITPEGLTGLEFYDPYSPGEPATSQIFSSSWMVEPLNPEASDAQVFSLHRYIADVYFNFEPVIKLIELPLASKTLKIQDNPSNMVDIFPFEIKNNSQQIGFSFRYGEMTYTTFPETLSTEDEEYKESYMHAKDYIEDSTIIDESIALQRYIQIYRLSSRPTALSSFDGNLLIEIDLAMEDDSQLSYTTANYHDTINTNQKYYYLFRILNQQRNLSNLSEIYEAELINDGGYLYPIFNVIHHYEIEEEVFNNPITSFKKLFQLQPNMNQIELITGDLDYGDSALSQIDNLSIGDVDDSIWEKTFKIRLTSKKTGKKIDLNITYNLNSD